jgi:8-amino-7-oxononanoate synthase
LNKIDLQLKDALEKRRSERLLRELPKQNNLFDFCSNDYLGLSKHPNLLPGKFNETSAGATGSRLISGNSILAEQTEKIIADFHHAEAALIFNNGYMANLGLLSSIADRNTLFIHDEFIHASCIDGMRLSLAKRLKFNHNNISDLEQKLEANSSEKIIVIVESVYSMDGDMAPLKEISELCKKYNAVLIVDEAHATGLFGIKGEGLVSEMKLESLVWARVHTFGKAMGLHGAAVVGSHSLRNYLVNFARSFIYTTAMPPHLYNQIQEAYLLISNPVAREKLFANIQYYKEKIRSLNISEVSFQLNNTPIQSIIIPGNDNVISFSHHLSENGFYVKAILSPTVAAGSERVRICLHSFNTSEQIDKLISTIKNYYQ